MFTPSSKYFLGLTGLALISAVLYMFLITPSDLGAIALFGVASSSALVAGFGLFTRDGDAFSNEEAVAAAAPSPGASIWPIVFALGAALVLTGLATVPVVFILGIGVLFANGAGVSTTTGAITLIGEGANFGLDIADGAIDQLFELAVQGQGAVAEYLIDTRGQGGGCLRGAARLCRQS